MMKKKTRKILSFILASVLIGQTLCVSGAENGAQSALSETVQHAQYEQKVLRLLYDEPAQDSIDGWKNMSIPIGNGYMGVSLFGDVAADRMQVTEQSLYTTGTSFINNRYCGGQENFADVYIDTEHTMAEVTDYQRQLLFNDALANLSYTKDGVSYEREYFSSYPDKVTVVHLSASGEQNLNFTLRPVIAFERDKLEAAGAVENSGKHGTVVADGDTITLAGNSEYYNINFEAQFKIVLEGEKGSITAQNGTDENGNTDNGTLTVEGADSCYIIFAVGTNYELKSSVFTNPVSEKLDGSVYPHDKVSGYINDASAYTYEQLKQRHKQDYKSYFDRVVFDIGGVDDGRTTPELITSYKNGNQEKYLEELYFQMGRYMMIASSREGTLPAGLQAIWNAYDIPPWTAGYWYNVNQQMNYWPAFSANLAEMYKSYSDFNLVRLTAAELNGDTYIKSYRSSEYEEGTGKNGWIVGTGNNAYNVSGVVAGGHSGPGTGGFTTVSDIDYYRFTQDPSVIENVYPIIESLARFYSKCVDEYDGAYLATISASPENMENGKAYQTVGCAFDQQMIYENNKAVIDIYDEYKDILPNADEQLIEKLRRQIEHYETVLIGYSGQVKEYREEDYYGDIGEYQHRHISQIVGLYPGTSINDETPAWIDGAKVTLTERGITSGTGWSVAHKLGMWARTGDGETSYKLVQGLIKEHIFNNLWNKHDVTSDISQAVFQAEGNFGGTAGICEMLLQSQGEYIKILPALPSAWSDGSYKGLVARGNFEVCTSWKDGIAENIEVLSNAGGKLKLNYPNIANAKITKENGETVSFTGKTKDYAEFDTVKGEKYIITDISPFSVTENVSDVALSFEGENTTVSWTPSAAANVVYKIYRAFESEPVYELLAENVSETSYTDSERNGRQATYKVTATAQGCEESLGDTATAIPQASSVLNVTAFMADETHLQIQWEKPKYAQKYVVYEYIDGGYVKLFETEDEICIIENASSDKTYAVSSLYYETESAKEHVVISEIGLNVSKLELYEYISQIKALSEKGFSEADMKLISDDINTVTKTWKDINATISEVEASIELAKKALESASYFSFNVLKGKSATVEAGNSSEHSGYPLSNVTDGDVNTRFAGYETEKLVITYELGELHTVSSFELVDFMDSRGSRDDYAVIEGKAANGKWLKMAERSLLDLTQTSSKRTASIGSELSLPVSAIRLTLTNTDSYKNGYSIWEFSAVGGKIDTHPKVMALSVNPEKPDIGTKYEIVNNIDNGIMFYSDRTTFAAYHLGSGFKGLTQLRLPVNDSTRQNSTALNTFLQGDNTYFTFTANSDGKVYIAFERDLPNFTEERGWKKISSTVPPLPDGHEKINTVDKNYEFSGYPYYLTQVQWVSNPDVIDYAAQRGFVYEKAFSAYENVEVPTIGIASNQNYFAAVELSGENSNTELEYIFCGDEAVKTQSGKTDYEFEVSADTQSVVLDALAKNLGAEVSCPAEPLTFTKGKASAEIVVSAGEKTTKYTVTVKKEKVISNVALNKTVTVDPVSLTSAGGFGSFSNEAIVDGVYANASGRYYSGAKNNITAVIDLGATYTISYINVAEILNNEPMRTDMLTIESYNNGEWSTRILNRPLNGEAETQSGAQYSKTRFDFEETFDASLLKFTFKNSGVVNGETAVTGTLANGKTYNYYPVAGTSAKDISIVEIEAYGIETQQEESQSAELSAVLIDGLSIGEIKADTYSYRVYTMSDSVTVKGIAKSSSASVSEEQVLDLSGGSAKAEITVTGSGGDVLKYEIVVFKVSNIALNKPVTIDPTSGYASYPNENVVDGDFTTRYARSGAYCPTVVIDLEDKYTVTEFDVAEFRNPLPSVPMRIDNLSIYGYVNDEWVLLKTGIKLDGEIINNLYSKTNIKLDEPAQNVSKLKLNFENTGYTNNYPIEKTITHGTTTTDVYSVSGTAKRDCSIMEIMAYGTSEAETLYSVSVSSGGEILSSVNGGAQENWESSYIGEYRQGTSISLNALSTEGKSFMYWKDVHSNRIVSYANEYEFTVGSDKNIIAVYSDAAAAYITFKNANGMIYASDYNSVVIPANPNMMGYTFAGWFVNSENIGKSEGEVYTANENTQVVAGWKLDDKMYTVTVNGANEEGGSYKYNSKLTLTTQEENSLGEKFAYWKRDGKIVCYDMTYKFYVYADTVVEAVYSDEAAQPKVVVTMSEPIITDTGSVAFFAERSVPSEMTVIESGILLGTAAELSLDSYMYKAVSGSLSNNGQYTVRKKNVSSGDTWYGKAYVVYRDAKGNVCTAYSNEVSKTID